VFSHGHYGDPRCCRRLTGALARAGFLVVAVHHADRDVDRIGLQGAERVDDVLWVLEHLDLPYDHGRIGLAGHSFGGVTAGETASEDPRPRAVVSLAGTAGHGTMASTRVPTLIVAGTRDTIETVAASRASAAAIPRTVPHELLVAQGASHGQLIDGCVEIGACELVERRAVAFLRHHLLGERTSEP
jgi:dienelactone hydrolase